MNKEDFYKALEIISKNASTKLVLNQPIDNFIGDLGSSKWTIHIKECCPSVINNLLNGGFLLTMTKYGLSIEKLG